MKISETKLKGLFIIETKIHNDKRGYFAESFNQKLFKNFFPEINFIQDNESKSDYGVLRGLHFQKKPFAQSKLVRVVKGKVQDVVVDLRNGSPTFGNHVSFILEENDNKQLFIPKGFAHGFLTLSDYSIFSYKVDNNYSKKHESGLLYNDKDLNISWKLDSSQIKISEKDMQLETFNSIIKKNF